MHPDHNTGQLRCLVRMDVLFWIDVCHIEDCKDDQATVYVVRRVHVSDGESRAFSSKKSRETKVLQQIKARIQQTGPIPVADYMKEVLSNPMSGFYMHRDVLGGTGDDVITSAQVSKLFGELVAEWGLHEWKKAGRPKPFYIVELGPNRGDLADDMCRVFSQSPEARELVSLHLVEISPHLSQLQELKLCDTVSVVKDVLEDSDSRRHLHLHSQAASSDERMYKHNITKHGVPVSWYRSFNDLPTGFAFYVSYELFDAYPIHKFKRTPEGWKEVLIDINDGPGEHHLHYVLSRGPTPASRFFVDPQDSREELEVSPESGVLMQDISARLNAHGGVNLVIDYGHEGEKSDTFRKTGYVWQLVAEWGLHEWKKAGRPKPFYIVELGPNRGDLADDMCRVFSQSPEARELVSLHLVEISPHLSQLQELKLCDTVSVVKDVLEDSDSRRHLHLHSQAASSDERMYKHNITKHGVPVSWYRSFNDLPTGFAFYVSYELFDAYPIHKFKRTPEGWKEVLIDINDGPGEHHLHYVLSRGPTPASRFFVDVSTTAGLSLSEQPTTEWQLQRGGHVAPNGMEQQRGWLCEQPQDSREELEVSPESGVLMQDISARLNAHGGVNLVIDYGHEGEKSDTFRAFRKHSLIDPLCEPGTADLTADVDFAYLKNLVKDKCLLYGPITQEQFLAKMSVEKRLESSPKEQHEEIMKGYKMLMDPQGIGGSYKFLSMYPLEMTSTLAKNPPLAFK
ncbi:NDUFAF7 [Cordylochernes scorpioides]|uniref:type II protein arginine methyltransferase n=1 Tax=Cordylochernes scorpioides TaxID=51811 RepID=A0ABY6LAW5_9ARAC|nr:NDUFAF7 [Cordylochernes scorpioides]